MRLLLCLLFIGCTGPDASDKDATTGSDETDNSDDSDDTDSDSATEDVDTEPLGPIPYDGAAAGWRSLLSDDGEEFSCEYVEETCPTDCDGNVAPVLGTPVMIVNGVASGDVEIGDHVVVRVEYSDADCNIPCGSYFQSLVGPEFEMAEGGSLCSNQPCEGETGFVIGVVEAGEYSWSLRLEDACGDKSGMVSGGFTL